MTEQEITPPFEDDFLAAELALGLSEGDALTEGRDRVLRDRGFAQMVAGWQERLVALTEDIAPVRPKRRVKKAILAQLFPKVKVPLMERLWVWQGISLAALVLAAYIALPTLRPPAPEGPSTVYAIQLTSEAGALVVLAVLDPSKGDIALRRLTGAAPSGRVLELWAILPDAAPVSLGVLPEGEAARVDLPAELAAQVALITLAISDEPPGGAPQGAPTGDILAVGAVSAL